MLTLFFAVYAIFVLLFVIGILRLKTDRSSQKPFISVLIAARNEEEMLSGILSDLSKQNYPNFEVIVVNDRSEDNTEAIIDRFYHSDSRFRKLNITSKVEGVCPKKNAISKGVEASNGEIILSTDADCRVSPDWIKTIVSCYEDNTGMVMGNIFYNTHRKTILQLFQSFDFHTLMICAAGSCGLGYPLATSGCNLSYRKRTFTEIGGFSEAFDPTSADDFALLQLIKHKTSKSIKFCPEPAAEVNTYVETKLKDFLRQRIRWSQGGSIVFRYEKLLGLFLVVIFAINAFMLAGLIYSITEPSFFPIYLQFLLLKLVLDGILGLIGSQRLGHRASMLWFPLWFILSPLYYFVVGVGTLFAKPRWKG